MTEVLQPAAKLARTPGRVLAAQGQECCLNGFGRPHRAVGGPSGAFAESRVALDGEALQQRIASFGGDAEASTQLTPVGAFLQG